MAKLRSQDLAGSLASGLSAGLKAYGGAKAVEGQQRAKSAEEETKKRDAEEKERQKRLGLRQDDLDFWQFRANNGDPHAQFMVEQYDKFDAGRAFTKEERNRLFEDFKQREADEGGENERLYEAMQNVGVDPTEASAAFFGQFLEDAGQAPADMGTVGGRAQMTPYVHEARDMLPPITRTLEAVGMPGKDPLPPLLTGGRERAYKRKLTKAQEKQDIAAAVKPEQTEEEKFDKAVVTAERKKRVQALVSPPATEEEKQADVTARMARNIQARKDLGLDDNTDLTRKQHLDVYKTATLAEAQEIWEEIDIEVKQELGVESITGLRDLKAILLNPSNVRRVNTFFDDELPEVVTKLRELRKRLINAPSARNKVERLQRKDLDSLTDAEVQYLEDHQGLMR